MDIAQGFADLRKIEANIERMERDANELRFQNSQLQKDLALMGLENEKLRQNLATALETIERLKAEGDPVD